MIHYLLFKKELRRSSIIVETIRLDSERAETTFVISLKYFNSTLNYFKSENYGRPAGKQRKSPFGESIQ